MITEFEAGKFLHIEDWAIAVKINEIIEDVYKMMDKDDEAVKDEPGKQPVHCCVPMANAVNGASNIKQKDVIFKDGKYYFPYREINPEDEDTIVGPGGRLMSYCPFSGHELPA